MARVTTIGRETPGETDGRPLAVADTSERVADYGPPVAVKYIFHENRAQRRQRERDARKWGRR
jgi:hypothetical protein